MVFLFENGKVSPEKHGERLFLKDKILPFQKYEYLRNILHFLRLIEKKKFNMIRKLTLAFAAVLVSVVAFAQNQFQGKKLQWRYTYKYVTNDPAKSSFYTLKNGLTVILSPTNKDPRIQAYVAIKAGSKTDPATNTGLAHYLEHMLFKGTDKYGSLDWSKRKSRIRKN